MLGVTSYSHCETKGKLITRDLLALSVNLMSAFVTHRRVLRVGEDTPRTPESASVISKVQGELP